MTQKVQTYDLDELTLTTTDPQIGQLALSVSTSLMTNYEPSRSVDSRHMIEVAEDVRGNPMVFSIGTANELYAIVRTADPRAAWSQIDLTSGLGAGWTVETFRLLQTPNQAVYLALAIKDANGRSRFYLTGALSNDPADASWTGNSGPRWIERTFSEGFTSIDHILMSGGADEGDPPVIVATATLPGGEAQRYYVNGDVSTQLDLWRPWPIPQNATEVVDVAVGTMDVLGTGSFILYRVGSAMQLDFTKADLMNGQYISRPLTVPAGATALGTLQNADLTTDLYVAGNGAFVFTRDNMERGAVAETIAATIDAGTGTELIVRQDSNSIALWLLDEGVLTYVHGTKGARVEWTMPLPIVSDVGQIAALRNTVRDTNELFLITADEQLMYLYQDPASTMWKEMLIPLADVGAALPYQCYATHITLRDQNGTPVTRPFSIGATEWTYLTINGAAHIVDQNATSAVVPDATGAITVISKVSTLSTPTLHLTAEFLTDVIDINPQAVVNNNLKLFNTADALTGAATQRGAPVISGPTQIPVATAAGALKQLTDLHDSAGTSTSSGVTKRAKGATPSNQIRANALPEGFGFAVSDVGRSTAAFHDAAAARTALPGLQAHGARAASLVQSHQALVTTSSGNEAKAFFGDVLKAIEQEAKNAVHFTVGTAKGVATFTIQLADKTISVLLDTVEKGMSVIDWVLKQIAIALDKLLDWLGFVFDWDDILQAHSIIVNVANKTFEYTESKIVGAETIVAGFFETMKAQYGGLTPLKDADATATLLDRSRNPAPTFADDRKQHADYAKSPGGSFAAYHVQHSGVLKARPPALPAATGNPVVDLFTQLVEPLSTDVRQTVEDLVMDLRNGFVTGSLTPDQAVEKLKTAAIGDVLQAAEDASEGILKVADDIVSSIKTVINKEWDIPFLTPLYKLVTKGSSPTLLDAVALLIAIPSVPLYKLVSGRSPFENGSYGLDERSISAVEFFASLRGEATMGRRSVGAAAASAEPAAILYSQIGGCFYAAAEVVALTIDANEDETEGTGTPEYSIWLGCEIVMVAGSFPIGSGEAVTFQRVLWGAYIFALLRYVALIFGQAVVLPLVGAFEIILAVLKLILILGAIAVQTANDTGEELGLEWETFFGNLLDTIGRGVSGAAKIDPDKEISGLALSVIARVLGIGAIVFDAVRLAIVLRDDELREYHAF